MRAESEALICSGAVHNKAQTYALLDERVAPQATLSREASIAKLARIYLQSHAPATLDDFAWWSGLSKTEARNGIEALKENVEKSELHGKQYFSLVPDVPSCHSGCTLANTQNNERQGFSEASLDTSYSARSRRIHVADVSGHADDTTKTPHQPALLLPAFDEYIIAYSDRDAIIAKEHQPKSFTTNGIFRPTIVAQGKVVGTWRKATSGKKQVELSYFAQPSKTLEKQSAKAVEQFNHFKA
jgi:hypothetical protein